MSDELDRWREAQRQKSLKREASLAKTGVPIVYTFGADVVRLTKQPMEWGHTYSDGTKGSPEFKSKYKVELNGVHRAWIVARNGWGAGWVLHRLSREPIRYWDCNPGGRYLSTAIDNTESGDTRSGREVLAEAVPKHFANGKLGTIEEQEEGRRLRKELEAERERESDARHEQWKREQAEERAQQLVALQDRMAALQGAIDRHVLTNYETEVVAQIVAEIRRQIEQINSRSPK